MTALASLPDGSLATGSSGGAIRLWDTRTASGICTAAVATLFAHTDTIYALAPLPTGLLASASRDATVRLWQLPPPRRYRRYRGYR